MVPRLEDGSPNEALMKEIADRWVSDNRVPPNLAKAWYMRGQHLPKAKAYIVKNHAKSMRVCIIIVMGYDSSVSEIHSVSVVLIRLTTDTLIVQPYPSVIAQ